MNLALWLNRAGQEEPERAALGVGSQVLRTYGEVARRVACLAGAMQRGLRLSPDERVTIVSKNCPDYLEILYASWHAGLVAVPANAKLHGSELRYVIEQSGSRACFVSEDLVGEIARYAPQCLEHVIVIGGKDYVDSCAGEPIPVVPRNPNDVAWLFYTSGTTGRPKGAMLTHRVLATASYAYLCEVDPTAPGDTILHAAPMSHGSGLYMMAHVMRRGVNVVPESGGFDADEIFLLLRSWSRTSLFAAPTMVKRLVECPTDLSSDHIRTIIYGGAPMYVEDAIRALDRFGPRLAQIYGQGESPMTITVLSRDEIANREHPHWHDRLASVGRPFTCVEVMLANEQDSSIPMGETGEILCRGDTVMAGYWKNQESSAATLRGGWLHTGDIGVFDSDGYLTLKGRSKDLIISGGANIYPREVEEILLKHDKVREVSVIGRPHDEWGEIVVAYVVGEAAASELDSLCLDSIARFKRPKDYVFVESLPKNNYGKVLKTELRAFDSERPQNRSNEQSP